MKQRLSSFPRLPRPMLAVVPLVAAGSLVPISAGAGAAPTRAATGGTVLQTNLVSDLPGVAMVTDPNLVNSWGISEKLGQPVLDLGQQRRCVHPLQRPGPASTPVTIDPLVVNIPTPVGYHWRHTDGDRVQHGCGQRRLQDHRANKAGDDDVCTRRFPLRHRGRHDHRLELRHRSHREVRRPGRPQCPSGHRQGQLRQQLHQPRPRPANRCGLQGAGHRDQQHTDHLRRSQQHALLYASNFRAGTVEVYDASSPGHRLPAGAFSDPSSPPTTPRSTSRSWTARSMSPTPGRTPPGMTTGRPAPRLRRRLQPQRHPRPARGRAAGSRGPLDSPWGLAIAPHGLRRPQRPRRRPGVAGRQLRRWLHQRLRRHHRNPPGSAHGSRWRAHSDRRPVGPPGRQRRGRRRRRHGVLHRWPVRRIAGLFGALSTATAGTPEGRPRPSGCKRTRRGPARSQALAKDTSNGASAATIRQDTRTLDADSHALVPAERAFAADTPARNGPVAAS